VRVRPSPGRPSRRPGRAGGGWRVGSDRVLSLAGHRFRCRWGDGPV